MGAEDGFVVRRGVPGRVVLDGSRPTVTINAMHAEPPSATVGVTDEAGGVLHDVRQGSQVPVGQRVFRVAEIVVGERGTVTFEPVGERA